MENLIPLKNYSFIFYNVLLLVVVLVFFHSHTTNLEDKKSNSFLNLLGILLVLFVVGWIGLRPISPAFVDMTMYAHLFSLFEDGTAVWTEMEGDKGFYFFNQFLSKVVSTEMYFFICALVYVLPLVYVSVKWFRHLWVYSFLMLIISFSFLGYGVNGIRNGMATSIFLLALTFFDKKIFLALWLAVSLSFHKSMSLPILGVVLTFINNDLKNYLKVWLASIPVSLLAGGIFVSLFTALGFGDARIGTYLSEEALEHVSGFRWDFVLYSATGIFAGWYFIIKRDFSDPFYTRLVNIYVFSNAFWIIVIRANFSNRFAYLSWFVLGIIIIYPLLKIIIIKNQHALIGKIILVYFSFTYLLNVLLR